MEFIKKYNAYIEQYGLYRCLYRSFYDCRRQTGLLERQFPAWNWHDRPISDWLSPEISIEPKDYRCFRENLSVKFFFPLGQLPSVTPNWQRKAVDEAEGILNGRMKYFSHKMATVSYPDFDWFLNPFTGQRDSVDKHWAARGDFEESRGDIKFIWEASRFGWVYTLVRAYCLKDKEEYPETFWRLMDSWIANNPPQMGPHWQCGQEIAIRAMAVIFALYAFWNSRSTTAERLQAVSLFLAVSAERIAENINFARIQMGNHATSEAAALWSIGLLFPEFKHAKQWRQTGQYVLEDEAVHYNFADGSYTDHSMNYQRLMLHAYLWTLRLAQINGVKFSDRTQDKIRKSYRFIYQLQDKFSGRLPNYGANDGALLLQLNDCDYLDYRPVLGAVHYLFNQELLYNLGPWSEDLIWLFGPDVVQSNVCPINAMSSDFRTGGYFTLRGEESWAMVRCHSYRSRPSQADMLHLDLWWKGINILRDSGTYIYYDPKEKWNEYFLSTKAHNTVVVGDADQMIKGPRFRWHSLVQSRLVRHRVYDDIELWEGEHYGYQRLPSRVTHRRAVLRIADQYWIIVDDILGHGHETTELFWQCADLPFQQEGNKVRLQLENEFIDLMIFSSDPSMKTRIGRGLDNEVRMGWNSLYYGERSPAPTLCAELNGKLPLRFISVISLNTYCDEINNDIETSLCWKDEVRSFKIRIELNSIDSKKSGIRAVQIGPKIQSISDES